MANRQHWWYKVHVNCPRCDYVRKPPNLGLELKSREELLENKSVKQMLQKGLLLEFKKDPERVLLAVAQKADGKKNWMVFDHDPMLLEFAWIELLEKNKLVRVEELAEVDELLRRKHAKKAADKELKEFVK
ncbi:Ribonuclease II [Forsythia ovata]|uniref:Ribonuclease II n=1 Tax=Forsythia ovata TaxID=205694 RepID=A0ABD1WJD7_9LAMI